MMRMSVDPGVHKHAIAWSRDELLFHVAYVPSYSSNFTHCEATIEMPRVIHGVAGDILDLVRSAQDIGTRIQLAAFSVNYVSPQKWKGMTPKPLHHRRVWRSLTDKEKEILAAAGKRTVGCCEKYIEAACEATALGERVKYSWKLHNLLDAAALELWSLGRIDKTGSRAS